MSLTLPRPGPGYDAQNEAQTREAISKADGENQKKARDVVIKANRLLFTSPDGTQWSMTVDDTGTVAVTPL